MDYNYKSIFTDDALEKIIEDYYGRFKEVSSRKINFITEDLKKSIDWLAELKSIKNEIETEILIYRLKLKLIKSKERAPIKLQTRHLNWFIEGNEKKLESRYNSRISETLSELLSYIFPEGIGGSLRESIIKACWHAKKFIERNQITEIKNQFKLEITKAQSQLLEKLKFGHLFISYYLFHLNRKKETLEFFDKYIHYLKLEKETWVKRSNIPQSGGIVPKNTINSLNTEIKDSIKLRRFILRAKE